uniref:KRAB domain-containing protein n=1 Tax=Micrurus lemniscatus lemniscatus TaxID=129467 RepID=A0A2D4HZ16_MICLE
MITFEDVSIHFTEEEWTLLNHKEKNLYWNVMHQNYDNIAYLASDQIKGKSQKEDPLQEDFEPAVEWLEKSKEIILQHPEPKLNNTVCHCPKNQQKRTLEKEAIFIGSERNVVGLDRDIILLGTEVGLQSQCIHYEEGGAIPINDQKSLKEEDLTGSYGISNKMHAQNFKQNLIREEQNDTERQQSEKEKIYGGHWRDPVHHETRTSWNAVCATIDDIEQTEPLILNSQRDFRYGDNSLETIMERISPSPDSDPMLLCSKVCSAELNEGTDLTSENQSILESGFINSSGNEGGLEKLNSFGSVLQEPATQIPHSDVQQDSEAQYRYASYSNEDDTSKISFGGQLITCTKYKHFNSFKRYACSNPEAIFNSLSALIKRRRVDRKYFSRRNLKFQSGTHHRTHTRNNLQKRLIRHRRRYFKQNRTWLLDSGVTLKQFPKLDPVTLNTQIGEALCLAVQIIRRFSATGFFFSSSPQMEQQERSFPLLFLDKMATEPTLSQVMTVLQQVAANISEIKEAISSLHSTVTSLQNGYFSECTVETEGGISGLEDHSQKTKAQPEHSCNNIKATKSNR